MTCIYLCTYKLLCTQPYSVAKSAFNPTNLASHRIPFFSFGCSWGERYPICPFFAYGSSPTCLVLPFLTGCAQPACKFRFTFLLAHPAASLPSCQTYTHPRLPRTVRAPCHLLNLPFPYYNFHPRLIDSSRCVSHSSTRACLLVFCALIRQCRADCLGTDYKRCHTRNQPTNQPKTNQKKRRKTAIVHVKQEQLGRSRLRDQRGHCDWDWLTDSPGNQSRS